MFTELGYCGCLQSALPLQKAFAACNLEPFLPSSVARYKAKVMRKYSAPEWQQRLLSLLTVGDDNMHLEVSGFAGGLFVLVLLSVIASLFGLVITAGIPGKEAWVLFWELTLGFFFVFSAMLTCFVLFTRVAEWKVTSLQRYSNSPTVPQKALEMSLALKAHCPAVIFEVEELVIKRCHVSLQHDPLLRVRSPDGTEIYYFAAWLEERFVF